MKKRLSVLFTILLALTLTAYPSFAETASSAGSNNNALYFEARSNNLQMSPGVNVGTQPFTFETYFKTGPKIDYGFFLGVSGGNGMSINIHSANEIQIDAYGINATVFVLSSALQVNTWHHIAVARDANNDETVWVDGVRAVRSYNRWNNSLTYGAVYRDTRNYGGQAGGINISTACGHCNDGLGDASTNDFAQFRITNYRIVVGSTVYDPNNSTITLPTAPLANIANTKVLLNVTDSSTFLTDSSGNQTITNSSVVFRAADTTTPAAPTSLSATAGDGQATISFTAGSNGGSAITNYKYSTDGTTYTALFPTDATTPITISGLTNGTSYTIYLKAVNTNGDSSASSSVSVTPVAPIISSGDSNGPVVYFEPIQKVEVSNGKIKWESNKKIVISKYDSETKSTNIFESVQGEFILQKASPGQTVYYSIMATDGTVLKKVTMKTKPSTPKIANIASQKSQLLTINNKTAITAQWKKDKSVKKYNIKITLDNGKILAFTTTDPNINLVIDETKGATVTITAIGKNNLTSTVTRKI